jgi:hypothetical protein
MRTNIISLILMCLMGILMPVAAQVDARFTGMMALDRIEIQEFSYAGELVSTNSYTVEENKDEFEIPGSVADMVIREMNLQADGSGFIALFSETHENPDVQVTGNIFSFSAKGQPLREGINEYIYQVEGSEILLMPKGVNCADGKCFNVAFFLKRVL